MDSAIFLNEIFCEIRMIREISVQGFLNPAVNIQ